ncbi:hypothetical protein JJ691_23110 [Kutzneria sp. CA-103260]|nr:hypothetical protein JJ691_23110 [Kutzneria sp. CA-103260]
MTHALNCGTRFVGGAFCVGRRFQEAVISAFEESARFVNTRQSTRVLETHARHM